MSRKIVWASALAAALLATNHVAAADAAAGRQTASTCAPCHGIDGIAKLPEAPNLAGESPIYITKQLNAFKSGERQHQQMSIIAQGLSDEDIQNVAAWYGSLKVTVEMPQ